LGERFSDEVACRIAESDVHPVTLAEFDANFAEALTYVPVGPMRMNSTIANAKAPPKIGRPKSNPFAQESTGIARFLEEGKQRKFDPSLFEFKSVKNGDTLSMRVGERGLPLPELRPVKGGLLLR
jgi:hypothetical protein